MASHAHSVNQVQVSDTDATVSV